MKIGLVCPYDLFKGGGVQECVFALQTELSARGHQALIITPRPKIQPTKIPNFIRLLGRSRDFKSPFHTTVQASISVDLRSIDDLLDSEQFDVLHFHEPWQPLVAWQILSRSKSKNVGTFHAKLPDTILSRTIEKVITPYTVSVFKDLDELTAVSEAALEYAQSLTDRKFQIIPNGIDSKKYFKINTNHGPEDYKDKTILYIGRLEKRKGLKYLLKAFAQLKKSVPDASLVIAGDGPDRPKLEQYVTDKGITDVEFKGYIEEADKIKLLSECAVFCSPAVFGESFGIVLLEAMSAGIPVVAGNNPGYESVMKQSGRLSLVTPSDTVEFARRLELFIQDQKVRSLWRKWAQGYVKAFDYKKVVDQYEQVYSKLLENKV